MNRKARAQELATDIYKSGRPDAIMIKELLTLQMEDAKDSLVTARGEDVYRAQGAAQALARVLNMISTPPPEMTRKQEQQ